ncbi:MAG: hypothetical protein RQ982_03150 [Gammaproteobacteria bacterium]|nr:hypothetical protein [Gammaproteobacteria bacterium]
MLILKFCISVVDFIAMTMHRKNRHTDIKITIAGCGYIGKLLVVAKAHTRREKQQ